MHVFSESGDPADEEHHVEPGGEAADAGRVVLPPPDVQLTSLTNKTLFILYLQNAGKGEVSVVSKALLGGSLFLPPIQSTVHLKCLKPIYVIYVTSKF